MKYHRGNSIITVFETSEDVNSNPAGIYHSLLLSLVVLKCFLFGKP